MTSPTETGPGEDEPATTTASLDLEVGDILGGKYRIDAYLAEGGMGIVLRATHLDLGSQVAIKVIRPEQATNEGLVARLLAEARIAACLQSKHVNRVLDVGRSAGGLPYLVLEHLEGSDLGSHLEQRGRLTVSEAADYVMQACEALAEAHAFGIVHRDLKPENLFLSQSDDGGIELKILDFGISKAPAARRGGRTLTNPFEIVGSPNYMAPEQIRGESVDARADIWALGVLLHELCSDELLFEAPQMSLTFAKILDEHLVVPALGTDADSLLLHQVILKCLRRLPEERYQDVAELAWALAPLGGGEQPAARVAKVAAASRARARVEVAAVAQLAAPGLLTPSALTTELEGPARPRLLRPRPLPYWIGVGVVAALPAIWAVAHSAKVTPRSAAAPRATPEVGRLAASDPVTAATSATPPPPLIQPAMPVPTYQQAASPAPGAARAVDKTVASTWPPPRRLAPTASVAPTVPAFRAAAEPVGSPSAKVELAGSSESVNAPQVVPADAWDPKNFGGRR